MRIITTVAEVQSLPRSKRRVLVPTMGALHKAHGELIRVARKDAGGNGEVAVSIFVNPLQFEPGGDYQRYPRPEKADEEFCRNSGVDLLFRPSVAEMYGHDRSVFVEETSLSKTLEGESRPGHFRGVCTVVAKLFNLLAPDAAVFVSEPLRLVTTATDPCFAAFNAKLRPAMPLPITTKSYSFIPTGYCRSNEFCQKTPPPRAPSSGQPFRPAAKSLHPQAQHNRSAPTAPD